MRKGVPGMRNTTRILRPLSLAGEGRRAALCLALIAFFLATAGVQALADNDVFLAKPYIQLGASVQAGDRTSHEILWLAREDKARWRAEVKVKNAEKWQPSESVKSKVVNQAWPSSVCLYSAKINGLKKGERFEYRVKRDGEDVFNARALALKPDGADTKFIVVGDLGAGTQGQKRIAEQLFKANADFIVMPGDLVYDHGRLSEYLLRFFPVYNSESMPRGVPLMRSTTCIPVLGNHDIALTPEHSPTDLNKFHDALAFYLVWSSPLNGPLDKINAVNTPAVSGAKERVDRFLQGAGARYPRMANFSFDYGNTHWLVLDANHYMDWTDKSLREWVRNDLKSSKARWKFVTFHQPGFSKDYAHFKEQRMRLLCDIFEECAVDVVFSGHAHNYQRTYPLSFKSKSMNRDGTVNGIMSMDRDFDGNSRTKKKGVIYIVTGAGGARLYPQADIKLVESAHYVDKMNTAVHSYTLCEADASKLTVRQLSDTGELIDKFVVSKD